MTVLALGPVTVLGVGEVMAALLTLALAITGVAWGGEWLAGWRAAHAALRAGVDLTAAGPAPDPAEVPAEATTGPLERVEIIHPLMPPPVPPSRPRHRLADAATGSFHAARVLERLDAESRDRWAAMAETAAKDRAPA